MSPVLEMRPAISDERHFERNVSAIYNRAIVMGVSLACLAAARVLSNHYAKSSSSSVTSLKRLS